jgi:AcrR family transcriptional regulator
MRSDAEANRERVLVAAGEVFGEAGGAGSTDEVARRAGVGVATVFRHFPTKQALVEAAIVRHLQMLTATARARSGSQDAGAAFRATFRDMVLDAPAKLALLTVMGAEVAPAGLTGEVGTSAAVLRQAVEGLLARGQHAGAVRADVSVDEIYVLVRALADARCEDAVLERVIEVVLDGLAP